MSVKVYQIVLTSDEVTNINTGEYIGTPLEEKFDTRRDMMTFGEEKWDNVLFNHYTHVATIPDTDDKEEAYHAMNLWDGVLVMKHHELCTSMTAGDIIEIGGVYYMCEFIGFKEIEVIKPS